MGQLGFSDLDKRYRSLDAKKDPLVLQALDNLSDDQIEYQIRDRLSFMRFLGLGLADRVPDATTVWLYREKLAQAGLVEALFEAFDAHLKSRGYLAMGGQIVDASIVSAPMQRNSREENKAIKDGDPPVGFPRYRNGEDRTHLVTCAEANGAMRRVHIAPAETLALRWIGKDPLAPR